MSKRMLNQREFPTKKTCNLAKQPTPLIRSRVQKAVQKGLSKIWTHLREVTQNLLPPMAPKSLIIKIPAIQIVILTKREPRPLRTQPKTKPIINRLQSMPTSQPPNKPQIWKAYRVIKGRSQWCNKIPCPTKRLHQAALPTQIREE